MTSYFRLAVAALLAVSTLSLGGCPWFNPPSDDNGNDNGVVDDNGNDNADDDNTNDNGAGGGNGNDNTGGDDQAPKVTVGVPAKSIGLDLVGIHDSGSQYYNADCISCHGDRTNEVALDGATPAAHSTMLFKSWGEGNARCANCHKGRADFLSYSAGGLREPVNVERNVRTAGSCTSCHSGDWSLGFYVRPSGD
jgi:hypothetical protein